VWGSDLGGGTRFFAPIHSGPRTHPASSTMGTGSFPEVKRPKRGVKHPTSSSAEAPHRVNFIFRRRIYLLAKASEVLRVVEIS
jgi:hypothetical protein